MLGLINDVIHQNETWNIVSVRIRYSKVTNLYGYIVCYLELPLACEAIYHENASLPFDFDFDSIFDFDFDYDFDFTFKT